ncbi:DUF1499 domain-containing protein [Parvularcula maris]|uniref:DUF1499 domain-containing protein n=1 Tax=Parvularcula maris TaxID=2965077 RepID=A0A9X2L9D6_9PROT|nr:DUF1499 domain-containing protein [Parvularcula maris]
MIDLRSVTRSGKPNQFLAAPENYLASETADMVPPVYSAAPDALMTRLRSHVEAEKAVSDIETAGHRLSYVATIPVFGFKDDVDVEVLPADGGSTLAVFSRSRVGYSDLGVNARRVKRLLEALKSGS